MQSFSDAKRIAHLAAKPDGKVELSLPARRKRAAGAGEGANSPDFITALARGLDVLRCFSRSQAALGAGEVAQMSGLPKSTVTRLIHTLSTLDYLKYSRDNGKYRLGPSMLALNAAPNEQGDARDIARPLMRTLAAETGAQVALAIRDQLSIL